MKKVFSGIQPTGMIHLGNYLGAIKNWVHLQGSYECLFCIVDMHAITSSYFQVASGHKLAQELYESSKMTAATLAATGVSPLFLQSQVKHHTQLMWILGCISPMSWFQRMTQFKEKKKALDGASLGLFSYPALMAADILLYKADLVPVGEDQTQHLELARDIAVRFNSLFETVFPVPEPLHTNATRVMDLRNPFNKMSKSAKSDNSRVNLLDEPDLILSKIRKAKTDSEAVIKFDEDRKELANLFRIFEGVTCESIQQLEERNWENTLVFKEALAEAVIEHLKPIREKTLELYNDSEKLKDILQKGSQKAEVLAEKNLSEISHFLGFYNN